MEKGKNIILRLGSRTIECGYEGSASPLEVFNIYHFAEKQNFKCEITTSNHCEYNAHETADRIAMAQEHDISKFNYLFHPDVSIYDDLNELKSDLKIHLTKLLTKIFYKCGMSTMNAKLLLITKPLFPQIYIEMITSLLIKHFRMRSVVLLPSPLMSTLASGSNSSIVIDVGWSHTTIDVIYDNRVLSNYTQVTNRGGCVLHYEILRELEKLGIDISKLSFKHVENMIGTVDTNDSVKKVIKRVLVEYDPQISTDNNEAPLVQLVINLIEKTLPIDLRANIASKIIINSSITHISGFKALILEEIEKHVKPTTKVKCMDSLGEWAGASLYSVFIRGLKKNSNLWEIREITN